MSVEDFIADLRAVIDVDVEYEAKCIQFHKLLKVYFPEAEPYCNVDHVITKIGDGFYDRSGRVELGKHVHVSLCCSDRCGM